ncbi:hypothetical protein LTR09_009130 [Extremus antarcticus]|uniref:Uncharacterized protein n=1 Tax=Extremus antarcticus TaxID=702011 RepID=A0AAJ0DGJ3_9PEZI|nr:hypothetical protein LTR09_009130 [Extremus antarcticus]
MDPNSQTPSRNRHNQSCTPTPSTDDRFTSRPRLRKAMRGSPRDGHTPSDSMRHLIERPPNPKETLAARLHPKRLQIGIDYGTMTFSAAYRVVSPGIDQPIMGEIIDLNFGCEFYAPQAAAWDAQGTFYWGWDAETAVKDGLIQQEQVVRLWKLALYEAHETSDVTAVVNKQLGQHHTVDELIATQLEATIEKIKKILAQPKSFSNPSTASTREIDDEVEVELYIGVPEVWKSPSNKKMADAGEDAGAHRVELIEESRTSLAFFADRLVRLTEDHLKFGEVIVVADIGGGTAEVLSFERKSDPNTGAQVKLHQIGRADGALCGSQLVTLNFTVWLKDQIEDLRALCRALDLHPVDFIHQASAWFDENVKHKFTGLYQSPSRITMTIEGADGASRENYTIKVEKCANLLQLRTRLFSFLEASGNQGCAAEVLGVMGAMGALQPVSRGALLRYHKHMDRGLATRDKFGLYQTEDWDPNIHHDAVVWQTRAGATKATRHPDKTEKSRFVKNTIVVPGRWVGLTQHAASNDLGKATKHSLWQQVFARPRERKREFLILWTESDIEEHASVYKEDSKLIDDELRDDIKQFGRPFVLKFPDFKRHGFKLKKNGVYEFYCKVTVVRKGANVDATFEIAKPGSEPFDAKGRPRLSNVEMLERDVHNVCSSRFNPTPLEHGW